MDVGSGSLHSLVYSKFDDLDKSEKVRLPNGRCDNNTISVENSWSILETLAYAREVKGDASTPHPKYLDRILQERKNTIFLRATSKNTMLHHHEQSKEKPIRLGRYDSR